jgi:3'-phosphoadenosine 5'-phosphosulfate sulfotransferase (PAPS reductase)/FAD synthetase
MGIRRVVMFSGGITSWAVARLVVERYGVEGVVLLFADTLVEDDDLYRFLDDAAADVGVPVTRVADGRTPWQVFKDKRVVGNTRIAPCSHLLKQKPCRNWLNAHARPADTIVYVGIDWTETHRLPAIIAGHAPYRVEAPLADPPYTDKDVWFAVAAARGLRIPRLYDMGFSHNNCGGACVRGGQAQWRRLLAEFPERYAENEAQENALRDHLGKDVAILRDRRGGRTKPLPLTVLRKRESSEVDVTDIGGCGCYTEFGVA